MVNVASTFGRSGTHDFVLLRATALVMAAFAIFMVSWLFCHPAVNYTAWVGLFSQLSMKIFTLLTLTSVLIHAWIGIWQVLTDYVKCSRLRGLVQYIVVLALGIYWFTGLFVLWGV